MQDFYKKIFIVIVINLLIWSLISHNFYLGIIGLINLVFFPFIFSTSTFSDLIKKIFMYFGYSSNKIYKMGNDSQNYINNLLFSGGKYGDDTVNFFETIYYFMKHYIFVISFIIFIACILEKYILGTSLLNITFSSIIFFVCFVILSKEIYKGDIYMGRRKLVVKDFFFIVSLELLYFLLLFTKIMPWYISRFVSLLGGAIFYIISIYIFELSKYKNPFKTFTVRLYLFILFLLGVIFAWNYFPSFQKIFIKEIVVYQEKEVPVEKIIEKYIERPTDSGAVNNTADNLSGNDLINDLNSILNSSSQKPLNNTGIDNKLPADKKLTYEDIIGYIVAKFNLSSTRSNDVKFTYIKDTDKNYNNFVIAYNNSMIGKDVNPDTLMRCKTLMIFIGLSQKWKLEYTKDNIFDKYWEEGIKRGYNLKCQQDDFVYSKNLP